MNRWRFYWLRLTRELWVRATAYAALGVQVRCAPGTWVEDESDEEADRWIKVDADGETEIVWRTDQ